MAILLPDVQTQERKEQKKNLKKKKAYYAAKRAMDLVVAIIGLVIMFIPTVVIILLIKLESPGPAIYVHNRIGKDGKPLPLLKFRSMVINADDIIASFTPEQKDEWEKKIIIL